MKEVVLPSGAKLVINLAPFADAKKLYQTMLKEIQAIPVHAKMDMSNVFKDLFCAGFASEALEACLWECFKRCTYKNQKIDASTFEDENARQDYWKVCYEVGQANVFPFAKSLYAELKPYIQKMTKDPQ